MMNEIELPATKWDLNRYSSGGTHIKSPDFSQLTEKTLYLNVFVILAMQCGYYERMRHLFLYFFTPLTEEYKLRSRDFWSADQFARLPVLLLCLECPPKFLQHRPVSLSVDGLRIAASFGLP